MPIFCTALGQHQVVVAVALVDMRRFGATQCGTFKYFVDWPYKLTAFVVIFLNDNTAKNLSFFRMYLHAGKPLLAIVIMKQ